MALGSFETSVLSFISLFLFFQFYYVFFRFCCWFLIKLFFILFSPFCLSHLGFFLGYSPSQFIFISIFTLVPQLCLIFICHLTFVTGPAQLQTGTSTFGGYSLPHSLRVFFFYRDVYDFILRFQLP